jgi:hypothetical protein
MRVTTAGAMAIAVGMLTGAQPAFAAPPVNDGFEQAAPLADPPATVTGRIDEASLQPGEPGGRPKTVWYRFEPSRSGRVVLELRTYDDMSPMLGVYTGASLAVLQRVGRRRGGYPRVAFEAVAGESYSVAVGGLNAWEGTTFTLRTRRLPLPANDAFADAERLRIPGERRGNIADATAELGEHPKHTHSLGCRLRPRRTGRLTIDLTGLGPLDFCWRETMRLYTGRELRDLRLRARTRAGYGEELRATVRRGVSYRLVVNSRKMGFGDFSLSLGLNQRA